jgi:succinate-semialdehyde dehydrogenase/glutarate-semialdehyde dehydrogenase
MTMAPPAHEDVYQTVDPASEKVVKQFPFASDSEVLGALDTAQKCYQNTWRHRSIAERAQIVLRAATILKDNLEKHAQLITLEMGKLIDQARWEVQVSSEILTYYAEHAEAFLKPYEVAKEKATVYTEPIGVILAIEPWNFPYYQLARVAGPQLMAGNVLLVKPAPSTPQCALAFAALFEEAGSPNGIYTNILCSIPQINTLIDDFRVRGVTLTGSERAGTSVAERAGRNLKKAVLELGGSDPVVILEDADLEKTIGACIMGRLMCMGQACAASKRFIVIGKDRTDAFVKGITTALSDLAPGVPTDSATVIGPLGSRRGLDLVLNQVARSVEHGAKVVAGGKRFSRPGFYMEPTVIVDISPNNPLFGEETFGPVFSVYTVETEAEAVEIANATKFGLGASVYSSDTNRAQRVAKLMDCGMVFVNTPAWTSAEMPWGGVKNSGFGRELGGELGIAEFVNKKMIRTM